MLSRLNPIFAQPPTVTIGSIDARFASLELQNYSDEGVEFSKRVMMDSFESNGCNYVFADGSREGWTLEKDEEIVGDLLLSKGTLDLNGHTLTVEGNFNQTGGTVNVNGGGLVVNGDYKIQNAGGNSNGILNMTNEADTVTVTGSFVTQSTQSHQNYLTAGTLTVGGDFYRNNGNASNFCTNGTHTTVLNGAQKQTVRFNYSSPSESHFYNFKMENISAEGIVFDNYIYVTGALSDTESVFTKDKIYLTGNLVDGKWSHDIIINTNYTLSEDMLIEGTLSFTYGTLNLNGHTLTADRLTMGANIDLNGGTLKIKENLTQTAGTMTVGTGKLLTDGNYALENGSNCYGYLKMTDGDGYVLVGGDFITGSRNSHNGYLTAGTLEVKGNFTQATTYRSDNFCATGSHKVILSGEQKQTVTIGSIDTRFASLELQNYSDEGVEFSTRVTMDSFESNGCNYVFADGSREGWSLESDEEIVGDLLLSKGTLDLNGHKLTVEGNLTQTGGTVLINGGGLVVNGDYKMQNAGGNSNGILNMTNEADTVTVTGSFVTQSTQSHQNYLTAGTLTVGGDFYQNNGNGSNFYTSGTHTTVLNGKGKQTVRIYNSNVNGSFFNNFKMENTSAEGIVFDNYIYVTGALSDTESVFTKDKIYLYTTGSLADGKWSHDIIINTNYTLSGDMLIEGTLSFTNGTLNLNGYTLTIEKNLTQPSGIINIGSGKLLVDGNYTLENGYLKMTDGEGYVLVGGNFTTRARNSHNGYLTAGTLEVKGDFTQATTYRSDNFYATGSHKVILSGERKQTVSIGSIDTRFASLELQNYFDDGVEFSKRVTMDSFESNGCHYVFADGSREGWTLSEDEEIVGDLLLSKETLDLNGHTLTVEGNLTQTGGTVLINGGELVVNGDYKIQNAGGNSNGVLNMTNEADTVTVTGSFVTQSTQSHQNYLTAGKLTVGGDFYQNNAHANNYYTSGTHTTVLNGSGKQTVKFANSSATASHINNFKMENTSAEGIVFESYIYVTGALSDTESVFTKDKIYLTRNLSDGRWSHDIIINTNYTLSEDMLIKGTLGFTYGTLNLNGHTLTANRLTMEANIDLNGGTLKIKENLTQTNGTMNIGSGKLLVEGDYAIENPSARNRESYGYLKMTDSEGYVRVGGDFTTGSRNSHSGYLTAGTLEIKGDFTQTTTYRSDNFYATGSHKVILSGERKQTVSIGSIDARFASLELRNYSDEGVEFSKRVTMGSFESNGCNYVFADGSREGWTLEEDEEIVEDLLLSGGTLDLNGHTLTVEGNLTQTGGTVNVNGGRLIVNGDYKIQNAGGNSNGILNMTNEADTVTVTGSFVTQSTQSHQNYLTTGTLTVGGDFYQNNAHANNYYTSGTHTTVLNGSKKQTVKLANSSAATSHFNNFRMENTSAEGIVFDSSVYITGALSDTESVFTKDKIYLHTTGSLSDGKWSHDLIINSNYTLSGDMLIEGTLNFTNGTLNLNGYSLTVDRLAMSSHIDLNGGTLNIKGNVTQTNGTMTIGSGKLLVDGNYSLENGSYCYGYLKMTNGEGYVLVGGNFTTRTRNSHNGYLTAGTLEVKGDFTQGTTYQSDNFYATGSHKVILSGERKQNVTFASTTSQFNILEISKSLSNGYVFSRTPLWNELIERETDVEEPSVPQNLRSTRVTSSAIVLKWDKSTDNVAVAGYRVYCNDKLVADIASNSYTHENLKANTVYKYTVRAYDVEENISASSDVLTVSTVSSTKAPSAPSDLSAEKREDGIKLTWSASVSTNLEGYYIYRNDKQIGSATGLSYLDKTAGKGIYIYYVRAFDDEGNLSNIRNSVTVDNQPPKAPEVQLKSLSATSVKLTWKIFDNDIEKYELYRNDALLRTLTDSEYTDAGLSVSELYRYSVIAYDRSGNASAPSETAAYCANDEEAPTVISIAPEEAKCTDRVKITAAVKDNAAVTKVTFQVSEDLTEWTDAGTVNVSSTKQTSNVSFTFNASDLKDGTYTIRAIAYDFSGNVSENGEKLVSTIHVNHTLPERPDPITLELTEGHAEITWGYPDRDTQYFNIYRSEGGDFKLLRGNYKYSNYFEQEMKIGTNYRYCVTAVNSFGSESEPSEVVEVFMETDDTAPEVTSVYPGNGADIKENPKVQIVCNDNFMLEKLTVQLAEAGSDSFETVYETTLSGYSSLSSFTLKTDDLEDGSYLLKLVAEDAYGNISVPKVIAYRYESCRLSVPALTAEGLGWRNQLSWEMTNTEKLAGYVIYRKDAKNASYRLVERVTGTVYSDGQVEAGRTYRYKVEAIDRKGNSVMSAEVSAVPVDEDDTPPVAGAGIDLYTVAGKAVSFSGASSYDNRNRIAKYEWDFGDGTNGAGSAVSHVYEKEGKYTAILTVYDTSGNTGTDTVTVTVHDGSYCMADFTVLSEGGVKLSNAMIYCESGGAQTQTYMTDSKGKAVVFAQPGEYDFYFCKDGYLPERKTVKIASEMQPVTVRLEEKELVTGELTVKPLDYTEMKNLGIDIYAPENQHVYECTTTVEKKKDGGGIEALVFYTNRKGEIIGGETSYTFTDSEGRTSKMFLHILTDEEFAEIERIPTVAVLTVTTDVAWTKEFFDVELTILNNAGEEFSIENCTASLNLPEGLLIADTYYGKELTRRMGTIAGGTSKSVSWIVRGDKAGSYDLSADFGGVLMPFEKAVTARFETREPLVVEGGNALYLEETRNMAGSTEYWNFIYKLTNVSDKPVYGVRGAVGGFAEFGRAENMKMIYPDGTVVYLKWNAGLPDESSVEIYFDALKYSEYDGADTLEPGESVIIYVTLDLREEEEAA